MYRDLVRREYVIAVKQSKFATDELKRSLKTSERVPAFIDRLADELAKADVVMAKRGKVAKLETVVFVIHNFVDQFLYGLEQNAQNRTMSSAEKNRLDKQLEEKLEPEKLMRDMGVMTDDEAPTQEKPDQKIFS